MNISFSYSRINIQEWIAGWYKHMLNFIRKRHTIFQRCSQFPYLPACHFIEYADSITVLMGAVCPSNSTPGPSLLFSRLQKSDIHGLHQQVPLSSCFQLGLACGRDCQEKKDVWGLTCCSLPAGCTVAASFQHINSLCPATCFHPPHSRRAALGPHGSLHCLHLVIHLVSYLKCFQNHYETRRRMKKLRHEDNLSQVTQQGNSKAETRTQVFWLLSPCSSQLSLISPHLSQCSCYVVL